MKLLRIDIQNFGCLRDYHLQLNGGLTTLCAPNGSGKSTLAAYIRCMFYGMPRAGRQLEKDLRRKYLPWQGGAYGGTLDFEQDGVQYRIARTFGEKPSLDKCQVYRLPELTPSRGWSGEPGPALFGIDEDAFTRSTFLTQNAVVSDWNTAGIQAKLSNLVENTDEVHSFEKALDLLTRKRKQLLPDRGSGGSVAEAERKLATLDEEILQAEAAGRQLKSASEAQLRAEAELEQDRKQLKLFQKQLTEAASEEVRRQKLQQYRELLVRQQAQQEKAGLLRQRYPNGIPEEAELLAAAAAVDRLTELCGAGTAQTALSAAQKTAEQLEQIFPDGMPSLQQLEEIRAQYDRFLKLTAEKNAVSWSREDEERWQELQRQLSGKTSSSAPEQKQTAVESQKSRKNQKNRESRKSGGVRACLLAGAAGLLLGILLLVLHHYVPGALLLAAGIAAAAAAGYLNLRGMVEDQRQQTAFPDLQQLYRELQHLTGRREASLQKQKNLTETLQALEETLMEFLCSYHPYAEMQGYARELSRLTVECDQLRNAREVLDAARDQQLARREEQKKQTAVLSGIFSKYGLEQLPRTGDTIRSLWQDAQSWKETTAALQAADEKLAAFRKANPETENPEAPAEPTQGTADPIENLEQRIGALNDRITRETGEILGRQEELQQLRQQSDRRPELYDRQSALKRQIAAEREKVQLLDRTISYLSRARQQLSETYLTRVEAGFRDYLGRIAPQLSDGGVHLDQQLRAVLQKDGIPRVLEYFSAGSRDIVTFCMRLALADALFDNREVLLILDDPFTNLDDENTLRARKVLEELSRDHQILYMTCSSSRS